MNLNHKKVDRQGGQHKQRNRRKDGHHPNNPIIKRRIAEERRQHPKWNPYNDNQDQRSRPDLQRDRQSLPNHIRHAWLPLAYIGYAKITTQSLHDPFTIAHINGLIEMQLLSKALIDNGIKLATIFMFREIGCKVARSILTNHKNKAGNEHKQWDHRQQSAQNIV